MINTKFNFKFFIFNFLLFFFIIININCFSVVPPGEFKDKINYYFDEILEKVPEVLQKIPPEIRIIAVYNFKTNSSEIEEDLLKLLKAKFEAKLVQTSYQKVVFVPELKPLKIILKEDEFSVKSSINNTEELREIGKKLKLDGIINCEIDLTPNSINLFIQVIEIETSRIVLGKILSAGSSYASKTVEDRKKIKVSVNYAFGLQNFSFSAVNSTTQVTINSCNYYSNELFITELIDKENKLKFGIGIGLLYLASGFSNQDENIFIGSYSGSGLAGLYIKTGIFFKLVPNPVNKNRDYLDLFLGYGKIFTFNIPDMNEFEFGLNSEISETFSISFYGTYVPTTEITLKDKTKINLGNIGYHFQFIKIKF